MDSLSVKRVNDILDNKGCEKLEDTMGFVLTVIRDNCLDDDTFKLLDKLVKALY